MKPLPQEQEMEEEVMVSTVDAEKAGVDAGPHSPAPSTRDWPWWWSRDEEHYIGPCDSRAAAIMEGWAEVAGYQTTIYVCQATQKDGLYTDLFEGSRLAEMFDDANDEACDPDGDAYPSKGAKPADWDELSKSLNAVVKRFVRDRGLTSWNFTGVANRETVDLSAGEIATLTPTARSLLDELVSQLQIRWEPAEFVSRTVERLQRELLSDGDAKLSSTTGADEAHRIDQDPPDEAPLPDPLTEAIEQDEDQDLREGEGRDEHR